jgi:ComF family protein
MSTLRNIFADVRMLLSPRECAVCGEELAKGESFVCTACRFRIPMTGFVEREENRMKARLTEFMPLEHVSALFFFFVQSDWQRAVHDFKYRNRWSYAYRLGEWYGSLLQKSGKYGDVDLIVPVPLHPYKRIKRSYNQSDYIADGISASLGVEVLHRALIRTVDGESQTRVLRSERWDNVEGVFEVRRPEQLSGRHILLVDDVCTTGATILSCCVAIRSACRDVRISVATLAASYQEFGFNG